MTILPNSIGGRWKAWKMDDVLQLSSMHHSMKSDAKVITMAMSVAMKKSARRFHCTADAAVSGCRKLRTCSCV